MTTVPSATIPRWPPIRAAAASLFDLIGPALHGRETESAPQASNAWIAFLCLNASVALLLIAAAQGAGRRGEADASTLYWGAIVLLLLPTAARIAWPSVSRGERLFLLLLLGEAYFLVKILFQPTAFIQFDELLHWITAYDILYRGELFLKNSSLPISPAYPGLEILATALANLTGLSLFPAAMLVIAVLRAAFVAALFLLFERISGSSRLAALAVLVYMASPNLISFEAMFAYETLGTVLFVMTMLVEAAAADQGGQGRSGALLLIAALLVSLAVTHHGSAIACTLYLVGVAALEAVRRGGAIPLRSRIGLPAAAAALALAFPLGWMFAVGNPVADYLGPIFASGVADLLDKFSGSSATRKLFVSADGMVQPIAFQIIGMAATVLLAVGLATGFFRSLALAAGRPGMSGRMRLLQVSKLNWHNSRLVLLTLAAFGFPVSVAFRLTAAGWEIGNRMGAFVFVAVGLVVAVSIVHFWQSRTTRRNMVAISLAIGTVLLGGITTGSGPQAIRAPYKPGADAQSVEPMGIAAADWTRLWLGEGNRFTSDRVNRSLLATYGQQDIVTSIDKGVDVSRVFVGDDLSPDALYPIRRGAIDYLMVDLRITTARAVLGQYFERGEPGGGAPLPPDNLLKFDESEKVGRIFDNGWIVIFDVRGLREQN